MSLHLKIYICALIEIKADPQILSMLADVLYEICSHLFLGFFLPSCIYSVFFMLKFLVYCAKHECFFSLDEMLFRSNFLEWHAWWYQKFHTLPIYLYLQCLGNGLDFFNTSVRQNTCPMIYHILSPTVLLTV